MRTQVLQVLAVVGILFLTASYVEWTYYTSTDNEHLPAHIDFRLTKRFGRADPSQHTLQSLPSVSQLSNASLPLSDDPELRLQLRSSFKDTLRRAGTLHTSPEAQLVLKSVPPGAYQDAHEVADKLLEKLRLEQLQRQQHGAQHAQARIPAKRVLKKGALAAAKSDIESLVQSVGSDTGRGSADSIWPGTVIAPAAKLGLANQTIPGDGGGHELVDAAVIVFCFNRSDYLHRTLQSLSQLPGLHGVTVYVSQDGSEEAPAAVVRSFEQALGQPHSRGFEHWQRERVPRLDPKQPGHAWLTQHYQWGLDRAFIEKGHSHVIIVEDDMEFSPDFLTYFNATAALLDADPTLWCISSWNDNGLKGLDWRPNRLFRTSYFPGLGWMMRRALWLELGPKWPLDNWDHWMRLNSTARGRECISPEVNRNLNFGAKGANMDRRMFRKYLSEMQWNQEPVSDFGDLSYLLKPAYEAGLMALMKRAELWTGSHHNIRFLDDHKIYLVPYQIELYTLLARQLKIWPFPRGHHLHLAVIPYRGSLLLLADRRFCPFLPGDLRVRPSAALWAVRAERAQSCDTACSAANATCSMTDFWFINTCEELGRHFPCERGCTVELGPDVPNYVVDPGLPTYHTCLVTQQQPKCPAAHASTARLCACIPV